MQKEALFSQKMNVYGVDFSGASDAGRKIVIATAEQREDGWHIVSLQRAENLPGGGRALDAAIAALRDLIAGAGDAVFGLDFPFSIPREATAHRDWEAFVRTFAADYPQAEDFLTRTKAAMGGRELRRAADREAKTPFAPTNWRMYRQTYYGIRDLLAPLVMADAARVAPMQAQAAGKPLLTEICPASTLKRLRMYPRYKGKGTEARSNREQIIEHLHLWMGKFRLEDGVCEALVDDADGDALDSAIAALTVINLTQNPDALYPPAADAFEGYVYQ